MPIPDYQTVMLPLLKLVEEKGAIKLRDARTFIADRFNLSEQERNALLPSGKQPVIYNRVGWAATYLRKAGLLSLPQRGVIDITPRGKTLLANPPSSINVKYLERFPEFVEFRNLTPKQDSSAPSEQQDVPVGTPEENLEASFQLMKGQVLGDLVERMKAGSPLFFEELVVETIVRMGYGGSRVDAGKAIGRSGDEGIDGVINEDRLGLDVIYIQAKRWEGNVGRPELQKFAGALQGKRAKKGIIITTSDFTSDARDYVRNIDSKVILISGAQLAELMWEYNIGLTSEAVYEVKKLDLDYFLE